MIISFQRLFSLLKTLLFHPLLIYKSERNGKNILNEFKEEKIPYTIPDFNTKMKYCKSKKKYLKPTALCESKDPEIIAMANKLGAYKLPDFNYAKAAFDFVNSNIKTRYTPIDGAVKTLKRGYGSCIDPASLFIALCRCGGIKARYKVLLHKDPPARFLESGIWNPELMDGLSIIMAVQTSTEIFLKDKWIECDVSSSPELAAASNFPIYKFGEPIGIRGAWFPDKILYLEEFPLRFILFTNFFLKLFSGITHGLMINEINERFKIGKKKLEKLSLKEYNKKAMRSYNFILPLDDLNE